MGVTGIESVQRAEPVLTGETCRVYNGAPGATGTLAEKPIGGTAVISHDTCRAAEIQTKIGCTSTCPAFSRDRIRVGI